MMKRIFYSLIVSTILVGGVIYAAPITSFTPTLIPTADNTFDLGTTSLRYRNLYISGTCTGCSGGGFAFPFTVLTNYNATSTVIGFLNGLFSNSSTTFNGTLHFPYSSGGVAVDGNGLVYTSATTTAGTGLSTSGNSFILDLTNANSFSGLQTFQYSSTTKYSSFVTASTTNFILNSSSFNSLLGSGLTNSSGALTVSGLTTSNFSSANISQWTNNSNYITLSSLSATYPVIDTSGVFSLAFGTTTANSWSSLQTFAYSSSTNSSSFVQASTTTLFTGTASTTNGSFSGQLWIPNSSTASTSSAGQVAIDTTDDELNYTGTNNNSIYPFPSPGFTLATTTGWNGTTTINLPSSFTTQTIKGIACYTDVGTVDVDIYHTTTHLTMWIASTTQNFNGWTTSNTKGSLEKWYAGLGTPASSPTTITCTLKLSVIAS